MRLGGEVCKSVLISMLETADLVSLPEKKEKENDICLVCAKKQVMLM